MTVVVLYARIVQQRFLGLVDAILQTLPLLFSSSYGLVNDETYFYVPPQQLMEPLSIQQFCRKIPLVLEISR